MNPDTLTDNPSKTERVGVQGNEDSAGPWMEHRTKVQGE